MSNMPGWVPSSTAVFLDRYMNEPVEAVVDIRVMGWWERLALRVLEQAGRVKTVRTRSQVMKEAYSRVIGSERESRVNYQAEPIQITVIVRDRAGRDGWSNSYNLPGGLSKVSGEVHQHLAALTARLRREALDEGGNK